MLLVLLAPTLSLGCGCSPRASDLPASSHSDPAAVAKTVPVPSVTTPAAELDPEGFEHVEVFRLRRDFGNQDFEIAMDAWLPDEDLGRLEMVRLWWFKTNKDGERGPFSEKTKRHFDIGYARIDDAKWEVQLLAGDLHFTFLVEADGQGKVMATATVVLPDGGTVEDCRMQSGDLVSNKVMGFPTGIKELRVTCVDAEGATHKGKLQS